VITGASSGIGKACALHLDGLGFRIFAGVRTDGDAEALRGAASDRLVPVRLDVTDPDAVGAVVETIRGVVGDGGLAGLVNNAGVTVAFPLEFVPLAALRHQFEVNVIGLVGVTQACLPLLRAARGRIVNVGSVSGRAPLPILGPYAASKAALEALTDAWRAELSPWGIEVSIVEPGRVATRMVERARRAASAAGAEMPPEGAALYGHMLDAVRRLETGRPAMDPARVVEAVTHALTAGRPKTRYLVGRDARLRLLLQRLPDRLRDRVILRRLEKPR
jgi:NAD(P)-dependent dehydrogenase (short-subunit alcohol dehydrogenase family)